MIEFYPHLRHAHIALALGSGALFALRGAASLAGMQWPHRLAVRRTSWAIDTGLLTAALLLVAILPGAVFANGWLAAKLALIVAYVVLGTFALRRGRTRRSRARFYLVALATFAMVYGIARAHHPLGFLHAHLG